MAGLYGERGDGAGTASCLLSEWVVSEWLGSGLTDLLYSFGRLLHPSRFGIGRGVCVGWVGVATVRIGGGRAEQESIRLWDGRCGNSVLESRQRLNLTLFLAFSPVRSFTTDCLCSDCLCIARLEMMLFFTSFVFG